MKLLIAQIPTGMTVFCSNLIQGPLLEYYSLEVSAYRWKHANVRMLMEWHEHLVFLI